MAHLSSVQTWSCIRNVRLRHSAHVPLTPVITPHQQLTSPLALPWILSPVALLYPLPFLQLTKPVSLIRPVLSVLTTAQSMKWIVGVFIALCCLTRRAHNGFIKAEVSFGWQWVNGPCAVCWQQGIGYGRGEVFDERFHSEVSQGHPSVSHKWTNV